MAEFPPGFVLEDEDEDEEDLAGIPAGFELEVSSPDDNLASQVASGFNEPVAGLLELGAAGLSLVTAPTRAAGIAASNKLFDTDLEFSATESLFTEIPRAFRRTFIGKEPVSTTGRVARRAGSIAAEVLPFSGGVFAAAGRKAATFGAKRLGSTAARIESALLDPIRKAPIAAGVREAATLTAGATGAATAAEVFPQSSIAEPLGFIGGSVVAAPVAGALTGVPPLVRFARSRITGIFDKKAAAEAGRTQAERAITRFVSPESFEQLGQPVAPGLASPEAVSQNIQSFRPSLAQATGSQSLIATERKIGAEASGRVLDDLTGRGVSNVRAIDEKTRAFADGVAPDTKPSSIVVDEGRDRILNLQNTLAGQERRLQDAQETLLRQSLPEVDRRVAGETIRTRQREILQSKRDQASEMADQLGLQNTDITDDFIQFADDIEGFSRRLFTDNARRPEALVKIEKVASAFKALRKGQNDLAELRSSGAADGEIKAAENVVKKAAAVARKLTNQGPDEVPKIGVLDIKDLRERLVDDLIDSMSGLTPSRKAIRNNVILKEQVTKFFDDSLDATSEAAKRFREFYFKEVIEPFEQSGALKIRGKTGRGFFRTADEDVVGNFFKAGDVTGIRQFNQIFAGDAEAEGALVGVVLDQLREAAFRVNPKTGVVELNKVAFARWLQAHRTVLQEKPALLNVVKDFTSAQNALNARNVQLTNRGVVIENSLLNKELTRISAGVRTPEQVIDQALKSPRLMVQLKRNLSPDGVSALKRRVFNRATTGSTNDLLIHLEENFSAIEALLGKEHTDNIVMILSARVINERVPLPSGRGIKFSPLDIIETQLGQGLPQVGARLFALQSGRIGARFVALDFGLRLLRGRSLLTFDELMNEALFDPKVAKDLAAAYISKSPGRGLKSRLGSRLSETGVVTVRKSIPALGLISDQEELVEQR